MRSYDRQRIHLLVGLGAMLALGTTPQAWAQFKVAEGVALHVEDDPLAQSLKVRVGPLTLAANSGHMAVAQAPDTYLSIPFDGWLIAYHPRVTDGAGETLTGRLLHHTSFSNPGRSDFLCPNKQEYVFGAGGELNDWPAFPGFGYRIAHGDSIQIEVRFHNPTRDDYVGVYLEVTIEYRRKVASEKPLTNVYPAKSSIQGCGPAGYFLTAGETHQTWEFVVPYSGRLVAVGGHLHDYGKELRLDNVSRGEEIVRLQSVLDADGRLLSMPAVTFEDSGGYRLEAGDRVRLTAHYRVTSEQLPASAMGISVGYFVPDEESQMARFKRTERP